MRLSCSLNNKLLAPVYISIVAAVGVLSLLSFIHLLPNDSYDNIVYAQRHTATTFISTTNSPPIQSANNNSTTSNNTILSTSGTATTKVKPDNVVLVLGVETTNKTAKAALSTNSATMNKVLNELLAAGVKQNETSTSAFSLSPNYNYSQGRNMITGFTATNSIQIKSSNINNTAKWIDTAISSGGATTINSVDFTLSNMKLEQIKSGLIKQAIDNSRSKADVAASTLGLKILGIRSVSINELEQPPSPAPFLQRGQLATEALTPTANQAPIIPGQEEVSASVNIVWLIG